MTTRFDMAVIGGGVIGLSLARALSANGSSLALVDASAQIPPATQAAAGMLAPSFEEGLGGDALYALSVWSLDMWPAFAASLEEETGVDIDFRADGVLGVALDEAGANSLNAQCAALRHRGSDVEMLSGAEARALEPHLSEGICAALYAPRDGQVDPVKLIAALRASIEMRGAATVSAKVETAIGHDGTWRLMLSTGEEIAADEIVVATGAARDWKIDGAAPASIKPVKGEALSVAAPASFALTRVIRGPHAYVCPKEGGRIVIGASEYEGRDDLTVSSDAIETLRAGAGAVAPGLETFDETARWAGLRPTTPDGAPILGRTAKAWFALGHHRNGVLLAPASARALAAEITGRAPDFDLSPFRPGRFG